MIWPTKTAQIILARRFSHRKTGKNACLLRKYERKNGDAGHRRAPGEGAEQGQASSGKRKSLPGISRAGTDERRI